MNPKLRQDQIASQLGLSTSTLQRYRNEMNMPSPYGVQSSHKKTERSKHGLWCCSKTSNDLKRPQMISNNLAKRETKTKFTVKPASEIGNKNVVKTIRAWENWN